MGRFNDEVEDAGQIAPDAIDVELIELGELTQNSARIDIAHLVEQRDAVAGQPTGTCQDHRIELLAQPVEIVNLTGEGHHDKPRKTPLRDKRWHAYDHGRTTAELLMPILIRKIHVQDESDQILGIQLFFPPIWGNTKGFVSGFPLGPQL